MYVLTKKREADRKSATSSTFVPHRNDYIRQNPAWSAGAALQAKLTVNQPGDVYEQEADRVADQVMSVPAQQVQRRCACGGVAGPDGECAACKARRLGLRGPMLEEEKSLQTKRRISSGGGMTAPPAVHDTLSRSGQPLDAGTRAFMEPRFGRDFGGVRVHTDSQAAQSAQAVNARAYTVGNNVVFGAGEYAPGTEAGRKLLAHELTHVVQQRASSAPLSVQRQLTAADCASDCDVPDGVDGPTGKYLLVVYADKEGPFLGIPLTHDVGHSWLKLVDSSGKFWTYGFWPQEGYDANNIRADVEGCVHHPDKSHKPTSTQTFELTSAEFSSAIAKAKSICTTKPKYNLFGLQCTEFVRRVLEAAGKAPAGGFGLVWESPNALETWMTGNAFVLGLSVTGASSGSDAGSVGLNLYHRHTFYSVLGNKLRLQWLTTGELSTRMASVSTGVGLELSSQRIYLPSLYLAGGGIAGELTPSPFSAGGQAFGAGFTGRAGLNYNIDEIATIGIEYNVVKDLVNQDPALNRLMVTAGIRLW